MFAGLYCKRQVHVLQHKSHTHTHTHIHTFSERLAVRVRASLTRTHMFAGLSKHKSMSSCSPPTHESRIVGVDVVMGGEGGVTHVLRYVLSVTVLSSCAYA